MGTAPTTREHRREWLSPSAPRATIAGRSRPRARAGPPDSAVRCRARTIQERVRLRGARRTPSVDSGAALNWVRTKSRTGGARRATRGPEKSARPTAYPGSRRALGASARRRTSAHPAPRFSRAFTDRRTRPPPALRPLRASAGALRAREFQKCVTGDGHHRTRSGPSSPGTHSVPTRRGQQADPSTCSRTKQARCCPRAPGVRPGPFLRRQTDPTHHSAAIQNSCNGRRQTRGVARRPAISNSSRAARTLAGNIATRSAISP